VLPSRPLLLLALFGFLAASCSSAVVTTPYGVAVAPPRIENVGPAPALRPVDLADPAAIQSYDTAPRRLPPAEVTRDSGQIAYDVAPRLPEGPTPPASAAPAPAEPAAPPPPATSALLGPLSFISQTVNNCGPASVAEVLAFWGINRSQADVQAVLRGDGNPYGMTPAGVPSYVASLGLDVVLGTNGSQDLVKALLRAGFPVIVNQTVSDTDLEFHYRPIEGFDDAQGTFVASDPLLGPQYQIPYSEFDHDWSYTGARFMVVYPPDHQDALNAALAEGKWDAAYAEGSGRALPWSVPSKGPAPVTRPATSIPPAAGSWYNGPVKVTFSATDQSGFGVANTSYSIDGQPVQLYRGGFTIKDPGKHTIAFHSVNFSGSREADQTLEIDIDQAPPNTTAALDGQKDASGAYKGSARLTLAATDDVSGIARTNYGLDGGAVQPYSGPVTIQPGAHTIVYGSTDQAGNDEPARTLAVNVQAGAPAAPSAGAQAAAPAGAPAAIPATAPSGPPPGGYSICPQFDPNKVNKLNTIIPLRIQLCDSSGKNLSHPAVALSLQYILGPPTGFKSALPSPFRFDPSFGGYEADEPAGLSQGTYMLYFTAAGDPAPHSIQFRVG
jgi:hypothetical protein